MLLGRSSNGWTQSVVVCRWTTMLRICLACKPAIFQTVEDRSCPLAGATIGHARASCTCTQCAVEVLHCHPRLSLARLRFHLTCREGTTITLSTPRQQQPPHTPPVLEAPWQVGKMIQYPAISTPVHNSDVAVRSLGEPGVQHGCPVLYQ